MKNARALQWICHIFENIWSSYIQAPLDYHMSFWNSASKTIQKRYRFGQLSVLPPAFDVASVSSNLCVVYIKEKTVCEN